MIRVITTPAKLDYKILPTLKVDREYLSELEFRFETVPFFTVSFDGRYLTFSITGRDDSVILLGKSVITIHYHPGHTPTLVVCRDECVILRVDECIIPPVIYTDCQEPKKIRVYVNPKRRKDIRPY